MPISIKQYLASSILEVILAHQGFGGRVQHVTFELDAHHEFKPYNRKEPSI